MAITILSKTFDSASGILNMAKRALPLNIGVPQSIINDENIKYMVQLTSRNPTMTLTAFLQDKFSFNVTSNWSDAAGMSGLYATASDLTQMATGKTLVNTMATRRKWRGSSPIGINLKLKFEAFTSIKDEVILPCAKLQALVLPSGGHSTQFIGKQEKFFLSPPGPNPFYLETVDLASQGKAAGFKEGQVTEITVGNFLTFSSIIVKSVEVVFESRMGSEGPIGAEVTVAFETYEMLTKERLDTAYHGVLGSTLGTPSGTEETRAVPE